MLSRAVRSLAFVFALALAIILLLPLVVVVATSFSTGSISDPTSTPTLTNFGWLFSDSDLPGLLWTTALFTVGASLIALGLGAALAWSVSTLNLRGRRILRFLPLLTLALPSLLKDPAWIELYNPQSGVVNRLIGAQVFDIYSMTGMIVVAGVNLAPIPYTVLLGPMESFDRSLQEASEVCGATPRRTLWRITIPALAPAFISALILTVVLVASAFETPVLIGLPGGIRTYISAIYQSIALSTVPNLNHAAAQTCLYLVLTGALLAWYVRATRRERRFVVITGRGSSPRLSRPSPVASWAVWALWVAYVVVSFLLPLLITIYESLLPYFSISSGAQFAMLGLGNYREVLGSSVVRQAFATSLVVAIVAVAGTVLCALGVAVIVFKTRLRGRRYFELLGMIPLGIPPIVFSIALLISVVSVPIISLSYGTVVPMVVAEMVASLPFALRILSSAIIQVDDGLLESSTICGASPVRTGLRVLMPVLRSSLLYSGAVVFILSFRELSAVVLLVASNTPLVPTVTFDDWANAQLGQVAALNVLSLAVTAVVAGAVYAGMSVRSRRRVRVASLIEQTRHAAPVMSRTAGGV